LEPDPTDLIQLRLLEREDAVPTHPKPAAFTALLMAVLVAGTAAASPRTRHVPTPGWGGERVWDRRADDWEPALAADPGGPYVYQLTTRFTGPRACDTCPRVHMMLRRSPDGGVTWGPDHYLCRCKGLNGQHDPQIEVSDDGTVFAAWLQGLTPGVTFSKSTDHGRTWSKPVHMHVPWSDKPVLAVSPDGQDVYVAFNGPSSGDSYVGVSHDGGDAFAPVKVTRNNRSFFAGAGFVAADGTVTFAENNTNQDHTGNVHEIAETSIDGGSHWTVSQVDVTPRQPDCTSAGCYDGFYGSVPGLAGDANGDLTMVYVGALVRRGPQRAFVRRSTDGGLTWSVRERISARGANAVSPTAVGAGPGDVRVWFMDDRTGRFNTWYRSSTDSGITWSQPARLSNAISGPPYVGPRGFPEDYGDYGEIDVTSDGHTVATWGEAPSLHGPGGTWFNRSK